MQKLSVTIDEQTYEIEASVFPQNETEFTVQVNGEVLTVRIPEIEAPFAEQRSRSTKTWIGLKRMAACTGLRCAMQTRLSRNRQAETGALRHRFQASSRE